MTLEDKRMDNSEIPVGTTVHINPEDIKWRGSGDLISREALKKAIKSYADDQYAENEYLGEYTIMKIIDNVPTVDISETISKFRNTAYLNGFTTGLNKRQQGKWVKVVNKISENETETHWECSECHNPDFRLGEAEFCSFCGTDMQKGVKE